MYCSGGCSFDYGDCIGPNPPECGDGVRNQEVEDCDGVDLSGWTCESFGYDGGVLEEKIDSVRRDLVQGSFTQTLIKGVVGNSFMSSTTSTEIDFYRDVVPKEVRIKQTHVDDISKGVGEALSLVSVEGQTRLNIVNKPETNSVSVSIVSNGVSTPIKLKTETKQFIHDSLVMSFNAPSNLRGFSNIPIFDVRNAPILPNKVYEGFCKSVNFGPGFCGKTTGDRANAYFDKYYLQSAN